MNGHTVLHQLRSNYAVNGRTVQVTLIHLLPAPTDAGPGRCSGDGALFRLFAQAASRSTLAGVSCPTDPLRCQPDKHCSSNGV